jgi:hypothetical protein
MGSHPLSLLALNHFHGHVEWVRYQLEGKESGFWKQRELPAQSDRPLGALERDRGFGSKGNYPLSLIALLPFQW